MNLIELGAAGGAITGAVCGGMVASASLGVWGWLVGVPVGVILGYFAFLAVYLLFFGVVILVVILFEQGPMRLRRLMRRRRPKIDESTRSDEHEFGKRGVCVRCKCSREAVEYFEWGCSA